ncbi:MAG: hypothetical protein ALECFALPRED_004289 [Alectoria fallacina]|uniref:Flavin-containing monooxygenase n=1 Tax=Alectoria fallacina TaxID=1903189 RepID=A0A8H3FQF4_9LECA|nr:MAG: hypothetical protein ALECFALPRED_004289 [Alectoria fallacina]
MTDPNPYPKAVYGRNANSPDVLIIGAGISGLCTAIDMIKSGQGRNFVIVEKSNQVGGTWNDNIYPGCCCDVLSHLYSYSFEPNCEWTREYSGQEEIQGYLIGVAHKYQLYRHIRFSSAVDEARWDDKNNKWQTKIKRIGGKEAEIGDFYTVSSDFLVSAVGQLNEPHYPNLPNINAFNGKVMHSARWDWDYGLQGKRVGIIGTGATAAQIIPEIRPQCSQLVVFQRTPAWVMPRHDHPISGTRQAIYKYIYFARRRYRAGLMDFRESVFDAAFDPTSTKHSTVSNVSQSHLHSQLTGDRYTSLSEKLTPKYPFSCKRIIVSDDYYPALAQPNVFLETTAISEVTPTGITMANGTHHELDCIILATGFRTTKFLYPIRIYGSGGHSLSDAWEKGASAYLGITVPSLPNFGILYGPNTNLAYNSLILQIEAQSLYINALIRVVLDSKRKDKTLILVPKKEIVDQYNLEVQERLGKSTYADPRCTSWFKDEFGRITTNWCGSAVDYQERVKYVDWSDYNILGSAAMEVERKGKTNWRRRVEETQVSDRELVVSAAGLLVCMTAAAWWLWGSG